MWLVFLMLTFSNGAYVQANSVANSEQECVQAIVKWKDDMRVMFGKQPAGMPKASTFLTGCVLEGQK